MTGPGWYPDPNNQQAMRWWDGRQWTSHQFDKPGSNASQIRIVGIVVLLGVAMIGAVMNLQSVNILTGTSTVWIGAVIIAVTAGLGFVPLISHWGVGLALTLVAFLAIANAGYEQHQINVREHRLEQEFSG